MRAVKPPSPPMNGESLWPRVAGLPLVIDACEYDRLHAVLAYEFERITTHVRLVGAGADGLGEDVSVFREDGTALHEKRPSLPLAGEWTLAGFCDHLATLELWPAPPEWEVALRLRRWAFESAALDLALRQAGRPLHEVLGLEPQPVRFVNSLGLGKEPSIEPVRRRPGHLRVELEAHTGGAGESPAHRLDRRLLAEAKRVDEAHRVRLQPEHTVQRPAGLAQREVERRGLERPLAKAQRPIPLRRLSPQLERCEMLTEAGQRPLALERQRGPRLVQRGAVLAEHGDVLAQPVDAGAEEPHVRRDALELVREDSVQALVLARLDHERKPREPRPQRLAVHRGAPRVRRHHASFMGSSYLSWWPSRCDRTEAPISSVERGSLLQVHLAQ